MGSDPGLPSTCSLCNSMLYCVALEQMRGHCAVCLRGPTRVVLLSFSRSVISNSFATLWTVVCQASLSMGFSRQEYWSGLPFPSPGDLSDPGIETRSPCIDRWILYHWATREAQWVVLEDSKSFHLGNHHTHVICLAVEAVLDSRFSSLSGNLSNYSKQHRGTEESGDSLVRIWIKNQQTADADCYT